MLKSISVVFPLYNEEKRLKKLFSEILNQKIYKKKNIEFIFVNDGSNDESFNLINEFKNRNKNKINIKLINYKQNKGKGYAIKKGVLLAKKRWVLTMDIDLSVKLNQIKIWKSKNYLFKEKDVYFGSRLLKNSKVNSKKYRALTGRLFNIILGFLFDRKKLRIKDTQCGFKLYKNYIAKYIFKKSQESGYIQDVEILLLLLKKKILVEELPVTWSHKAGSKVNIFLDSVLMFFDLIKLKSKFIYR